MKKRYYKPVTVAVEVLATDVLAVSLPVGGTTTTDKVTDESQVLTRKQWDSSLWSNEEEN